MKILHTADWHLGKIVNYVHMTEDQRYILQQFVEIVQREKPDVIIIAGDLYDRSIPPKQAVELLNETLTTLINDYQVPVLAISGNHDSPDRLNFGSQMFRKQGLFLDTKLQKEREPVTLYDQDGPVHFHLIPYVEPAEVAYAFEDEAIKTHQQAAEVLIRDIEQRFNMDDRHVWIGHSFLAGGMESESEERLSMIGGSPYVDARLFKAFSYVALGHLHQPQRVTEDYIRYSGSILKYSFSEVNHAKSVTLIDMDREGSCVLEKIPLTPLRDFQVIEGYFEDLLTGEATENPENYLHVRLLDDGQLVDPMGKLRKVYPNILHLERRRSKTNLQMEELQEVKKRQKLSHADLFASFYEDIKGESIPLERKELIEQAIDKLRKEERGR
ncbi:exonuclease SbcCD subunit D [Halobacillus trueperi]|uniref:Nuclease SbcCD subunit D n=2 Tax=Halobacillus TaxID=45667 RepID=A0A1H0NFF3_HALAD|nr:MULTISPECIES: exonuclease SbcCD subunit D [Halobacillus]RDY68438.1 exonuclease SbcCD subunit D [Halobacillus trueperi]SDO91306.1 exonuclease SbcD [Halobacillus aidingensis]